MSLSGLKCIEAFLNAYTPWWGGDYKTATMSNNRIAPLTSDTLKGVMRWVARGLIAAALGGAPPIHLLDEMLEEWFGGVRGRVAKASILHVHVEPCYDETGAYKATYDAFDALWQSIRSLSNVLQQEASSIPGCRGARVNEARLMIEVLEVIGRNLVEQGVGLSQVNPAKLNTQQVVNDLINVIQMTLSQIIQNCSSLKGKRGRNYRQRIISRVQSIVGSVVNQVLKTIAGNVVADAITRLMTVPRVKLLALGARTKDELFEKLPVPLVPSTASRNTVPCFQVKLCVDTFACTARGVDCDSVLRFSLATLALAAILIGFGKASSRGFGRFTVRVDTRDLPQEYRRLAERINSCTNILQGGSTERLVDELKKLIEDAVNEARRLVEQTKGLSGEMSHAPNALAPSFALSQNTGKSHVRLRSISNVRHPLPIHPQLLGRGDRSCGVKRQRLASKPRVADIFSALSAIGNATLKVAWKIACCATSDSHGSPFHTWILGLPRTQQGRGYRLGSGEGRRKSPIVLMPVCAQGACTVLVAEFRTYDDHLNVLRGVGGRLLQHVSAYNVVAVSSLLGGQQNDTVTCCASGGRNAHLVRVGGGQVCSNCSDAVCRVINANCIDTVFDSAYSFIEYLLA